jgi:hypothetical protein
METRRPIDCEVILDERAAIERALGTMEHGEICAIFTDDIDGARELVTRFGAAPATSLDLGVGAWDARGQGHDKAA